MFSFKMDTSDASSSAMLTVPSQSGQVVAAQESSRIKVEATFDTLSNPARVMKGQLKVLTMLRGRYTPVKDVRSPFDCKLSPFIGFSLVYVICSTGQSGRVHHAA